MTVVKICGLSELEHALAAAEAGADFIGMVFAESRRKVTPIKARDISLALHRHGDPLRIAGVFAGIAAAEVNRIAAYCGLDRVQLSGGETWQYCLQIDWPITKTLHITPSTTTRQVLDDLEEGSRVMKNKDVLFLLDTKLGVASGGTGHTFDWSLAKEVAARFPVMVAGGLDADNVAELIHQVQPWGVDVSSGVETEGRKDPAKIRAFIEAVKRADTSQPNREIL
jgi:phosphoribosylanthranilate isomerase